MKKFGLIFLIFFSGCAYVSPFVQDFNIVSIPQEQAIGRQAELAVQQQMPLVSDSSVTARVEDMGNRLVAALPQRPFDFDFYVVRDDSPNAFTIPGGKIYVHTGLLKFASDDDELAGVIAHEIGHAYARHPAKAISRAYGIDYLSKMLLGENKRNFQKMILQFAAGGVMSHYGRAEEYEADTIGHELAVRAGYRSDGLVRFFKKLMALERRGGVAVPFLSSHPPTAERIARLEALDRQAGINALAARPRI